MPNEPVRIGSQLFTNRGDTPGEARAWVRQMRASRLSIMRLFIFWDQVEPDRDEWDFRVYDALFDESEQTGMRVVPTLTAGSPPAWVRTAYGIYDPQDLDNPAVWKLSLAYVRRVVERYHASPALDSWILWNEPGYRSAPSDYGERAYQAFLKKSYGEIDALNRVYHNRYPGFKEAAREHFSPGPAAEFSPYPERLDWMRFAVDSLVEKLGEIGEQVRKLEALHPLHVNPHNVSQCILPSGQSIWEEARVVDFLGCRAHPSWHPPRFPPERRHLSVSLFADLVKSATPHRDGLFWVTELQGGTNIFSGVDYLCPSPADLRHWMWESIGAGAKAVVFWCFNARKAGFEGGEWGLVDQQGNPSPRLKAVEDTARILDEHADLFAAARPPRPDVWILHSEHSGALGLLEGSLHAGDGVDNPRNPQMASDALCGAYLMCSELGLNVQFIDEAGFQRSEFAEGSLLLLPGATALDSGTLRAAEAFVRKGGTLIADGLVGYKDRNGGISPENRAVTDELFGAALVDIRAGREIEIALADTEAALPGWFLQCVLSEKGGAEVLGRFAGGEPGVVRHRLGAGTAARIGTVFFQNYFRQGQPAYLALLRSLLPMPERDVVLENPSHSLRMKRLCAEGADILILINTGETAPARLRFGRAGKLECLHQPLAYDYAAGAPIEIEIPTQGVLVFRSTR